MVDVLLGGGWVTALDVFVNIEALLADRLVRQGVVVVEVSLLKLSFEGFPIAVYPREEGEDWGKEGYMVGVVKVVHSPEVLLTAGLAQGGASNGVGLHQQTIPEVAAETLPLPIELHTIPL